MELKSRRDGFIISTVIWCLKIIYRTASLTMASGNWEEVHCPPKKPIAPAIPLSFGVMHNCTYGLYWSQCNMVYHIKIPATLIL